MNGVTKGMLIVLVIIYVIFPVDFVPGPVDDFIVILMALASQKKIEDNVAIYHITLKMKVFALQFRVQPKAGKIHTNSHEIHTTIGGINITKEDSSR